MKVRCIGGPLDDTELDVQDPPPPFQQAPWPTGLLEIYGPHAVTPMPQVSGPHAVYQLQKRVTSRGERELQYFCPQRHSPLRPAQAAVLRAEGRTYRRIAEELGYDSPAEVVRDIDVWRDEHPAEPPALIGAAEQAMIAVLRDLPYDLVARLRGLDSPSDPRGTMPP